MANKTLSVKATAERLKMSDDTVRTLLREGRLRGYQMTPGKETSPFFIYEDSVIAFEKSREVRPFHSSSRVAQ